MSNIFKKRKPNPDIIIRHEHLVAKIIHRPPNFEVCVLRSKDPIVRFHALSFRYGYAHFESYTDARKYIDDLNLEFIATLSDDEKDKT